MKKNTTFVPMNKEKILQKLGIEGLNAMQEKALKAIGETQKDVIVLSPTGSGKTLAYLLPLVALVDANKEDAQALVLVPGRELALQSQKVLKDMGTGLHVPVGHCRAGLYSFQLLLSLVS